MANRLGKKQMFLIDARGGMESEEFCGGVGILEQEQSFWMSSFRRGGIHTGTYRYLERSSLTVDKRIKELSCPATCNFRHSYAIPSDCEEALLNEKPRRSN